MRDEAFPCENERRGAGSAATRRRVARAEADARATIREGWPFRHISGYRNAIRLALFNLGRGKARGR